MSANVETVHKVQLNDADFNYLNKSASSVSVYWFIDCIYQENTTSYTFSSNYTQADTQHNILGIVVANIPQSPVITTTTSPPNVTAITPTSTITTSTAISASNATAAVADINDDPSNVSTTTVDPATEPTDVHSSSRIINSIYTSECQEKKNDDLLLSAVQLKNEQKYGYFNRSILVKGKLIWIRMFV